MIIEFFGVAGAGKSTLVARLEKMDGYETIPAYVSKFFSILFIFSHPFFTCRWVRTLVSQSKKTKTWPLLRFKLAVFINTVGRIQYAHLHSSKNKVILIDEGTIQRLLSLFETKESEENLKKWLKYFPHTDLVVYVKNLSRRIAKRRVGTKRRQFGEEYVKNWPLVLESNSANLGKVVLESDIPKYVYEWDEYKNNSRDLIDFLEKNKTVEK